MLVWAMDIETVRILLYLKANNFVKKACWVKRIALKDSEIGTWRFKIAGVVHKSYDIPDARFGKITFLEGPRSYPVKLRFINRHHIFACFDKKQAGEFIIRIKKMTIETIKFKFKVFDHVTNPDLQPFTHGTGRTSAITSGDCWSFFRMSRSVREIKLGLTGHEYRLFVGEPSRLTAVVGFKPKPN